MSRSAIAVGSGRVGLGAKALVILRRCSSQVKRRDWQAVPLPAHHRLNARLQACRSAALPAGADRRSWPSHGKRRAEAHGNTRFVDVHSGSPDVDGLDCSCVPMWRKEAVVREAGQE